MENYRKAPKIYHDIKKEDLSYLGNYFLIYQRLYEIIYYKLSGKHGNQIKLIQTLLGTIGDGSFGISEKWITHTCRFSQQRYIEARKSLIEMGWLELKDKKLTVKISNMLKDGELMDLEDAHADGVDEEDKPHAESNNPHADNKEAHVESKKAHSDDVRNREELINNKEITTDVVLNLYNNLSNEYFIKKENIRTRIEKKLSTLNRSNIDLHDFLSFWINIISELKENRFEKNISQSSVIEYDLSTALNKYDTVYNTNFKSGYKIYKDDILDIYDQEKYNKIISCIGDRFYTFTEDHLSWFNNESKKAYKISTFMRYRNLKEYKSNKKQKKEYETEY